jgi:cytochrome c oxidase subunit I+III
MTDTPRDRRGDVEPLPEAPPLEVREAQAQQLLRAWYTPKGWRYWSAVNNSEVGLWYTGATFFFLLFGGVLALIMRVQLARPDQSVVSPDLYNQLFTVHGSVMMFLFAIPVFEAIAVMFLPQMLGARDLPFPRLSAFGFWAFLIGGLFLSGSIFVDAAPRGGWFMYPPLTSSYQPGIGPDIWLLGFSFIEVAAIAAAVEMIVGSLKCRPPGMRLNLVPLYVWYVLVASAMILFAFPPLIAGSLLLEVERAFHWPFFDPLRGGDPLLWQHLFWLFGHPEVYIIFLPSVALIAMIIPTFARRPIVGYSWVVLSAIGTGFISFGLWVHHMFTTGLPGITLGLFSAASEAVAIPTGVQIFCFIATVAAGRTVRSVPMLFTFGSLAIFVLGGLTGVMVAIAPFDFQAHDTFFVVGHFHYVLIGGALFPIFAGCYYFYPLINGKMLSERLGRLGFWFAFVGFNITFLPMHLTGLHGMARRVFTYPAGIGLDGLNLTSSIGAFILAFGVGIIFWDLVRPKGHEPYAPRNPWNAGTLEWVQEMPGKPWGIRSIPEIDGRCPLWEQPQLLQEIDEGRHYLPDAKGDHRETLITTVVDATPIQCMRMPGPSFLPLLAAVTTGGFFVFGTFHLWTLALASLAVAVLVICRWLWVGTAVVPRDPIRDVGLGLSLPTYVSGRDSVGWWAVFITMLASQTAFWCLVFGYFFFWSQHAEFPPAGVTGPGVFWPVTGAAGLIAAWLSVVAARWSNRANRPGLFYTAIAACLLCTAGGAAALVWAPIVTNLDPTAHAYQATVWILIAWVLLHLITGVIMVLFSLVSRAAGRMTATHDIDICNTVLFWHFTAFTAVITVAVIAGFPLVS